ncbi:hypothetical protein VNO77_20193 [Canavalia gladiata]|uniref:Uncharacterized protein n=1 Tax=Canavalia gladiata TaxID=3824 RepID=A0AAN9LPP7_CANGL
MRDFWVIAELVPDSPSKYSRTGSRKSVGNSLGDGRSNGLEEKSLILDFAILRRRRKEEKLHLLFLSTKKVLEEKATEAGLKETGEEGRHKPLVLERRKEISAHDGEIVVLATIRFHALNRMIPDCETLSQQIVLPIRVNLIRPGRSFSKVMDNHAQSGTWNQLPQSIMYTRNSDSEKEITERDQFLTLICMDARVKKPA